MCLKIFITVSIEDDDEYHSPIPYVDPIKTNASPAKPNLWSIFSREYHKKNGNKPTKRRNQHSGSANKTNGESRENQDAPQR